MFRYRKSCFFAAAVGVAVQLYLTSALANECVEVGSVDKRGRVTERTNVNLRVETDRKSKSLGQYDTPTKFILLDRRGNWQKLRLCKNRKKVGWMSSQFTFDLDFCPKICR